MSGVWSTHQVHHKAEVGDREDGGQHVEQNAI